MENFHITGYFAVGNVSCCLDESANDTFVDIKRVLRLKLVGTSRYGCVCDMLESVCLLVPCHQKGKCPIFFNLPHKLNGGLILR